MKEIDLCTDCVYFEWKNGSHFCSHYKGYLNNLTPCQNAKEKIEEYCDCKTVSECKGYGTPNCLIR